MILDTNALSAFARGDAAIREIMADAPGPFLPVIVLGEYRFGLMAGRDRDRLMAWLTALAGIWPILDLTAGTAIHYAEIRVRLKQRATPIPSNDAWIAALAREHDLPILSDDAHFDSVPGIQRMSWR